MTPSCAALHCKSFDAHCPQAMRQCIAGVALSIALGSEAVHCLLPKGSETVHYTSCTAHGWERMVHIHFRF